MQFLQSLFGGGTPSGPGALGEAFIPPFESPGGITPEEQALADFQGGEGLVGIANEFGTSGTGASTMETQAAGGVNFGKAKEMGQLSDINQGAQYTQYQNEVQNQLTELGQLAQQEQANNQSGGVNAATLGQLAGQSGLFGTNQGNLNTNTGTS